MYIVLIIKKIKEILNNDKIKSNDIWKYTTYKFLYTKLNEIKIYIESNIIYNIIFNCFKIFSIYFLYKYLNTKSFLWEKNIDESINKMKK